MNSTKKTARIAGLLYLLLALTSTVGLSIPSFIVRGDAAATGERRAIHRGDERLGKTPDAAEDARHATGVVHIFLMRLAGDGGEHFEIHACAERFADASEDTYARVTFFDGVEGGLQLGKHLRGNGVALFWAIKRQDRQFAREFQF